jgi:hypothetical protein
MEYFLNKNKKPELCQGRFQLYNFDSELFHLGPKLVRVAELGVRPVGLLHLLEAVHLLVTLGQLVLDAAYLQQRK